METVHGGVEFAGKVFLPPLTCQVQEPLLAASERRAVGSILPSSGLCGPLCWALSLQG